MTAVQDWTARNAPFAAELFQPELRMMPALRTIVIGCVDPRVDPSDVLGLQPGEVAAIRNVGGRVTPEVITELELLRSVTQAAGGDLGPGWEVVVLQHTDCGITRLQDRTDLLGRFFGADADQLSSWAVADPRAAIARDVEALRTDPRIPGVAVSGLLYDVATGAIAVIAAP